MTELIENEEELEDILTTPRPKLVQAIREVRSPLVILGAGGKMGPTLALLARRAAQEAGHALEVIAVSRYGDRAQRDWFEERGVQTVAADLLDREEVAGLPDAGDVLYLVGLKFGTQANPSLTWAVNTIVPHHALERYRGQRVVALSTGNVYPMTAVAGDGSQEGDALIPVGEYPNAAVARERMFDYHSREHGSQVALLRLNYATDLRYGVPVDLARKVLNGEPIDLRNGAFNCIWQGDASEMILRSFALAGSPARPWNLTSPSAYRVREAAARLGELFERKPVFTGAETESALLSNAAALCGELGDPPTDFDLTLRRTAHWLTIGGRALGKPTHFEVRDGIY